jgi:hypothetical protein
VTELSFVNKPHNNHYYEWGKNCITLGYDESSTKKAIEPFGEMAQEDSDMFWEGYNDGPRPSGEIYSLGRVV